MEKVPQTLQALMRAVGRQLDGLSHDELEELQVSADLLGCLVHGERKERSEKAQQPRGRAGLRLAAADGELTEAGVRVVRARKAAKARWANRSCPTTVGS